MKLCKSELNTDALAKSKGIFRVVSVRTTLTNRKPNLKRIKPLVMPAYMHMKSNTVA